MYKGFLAAHTVYLNTLVATIGLFRFKGFKSFECFIGCYLYVSVCSHWIGILILNFNIYKAASLYIINMLLASYRLYRLCLSCFKTVRLPVVLLYINIYIKVFLFPKRKPCFSGKGISVLIYYKSFKFT